MKGDHPVAYKNIDIPKSLYLNSRLRSSYPDVNPGVTEMIKYLFVGFVCLFSVSQALAQTQQPDLNKLLLDITENRQAEIAQTLAAHPQLVNASDKSNIWIPLMQAISAGKIEIVQLLLDHGADLNVRNYAQVTPLMLAADLGFKEITQLLVERGADIDVKGYCTL